MFLNTVNKMHQHILCNAGGEGLDLMDHWSKSTLWQTVCYEVLRLPVATLQIVL